MKHSIFEARVVALAIYVFKKPCMGSSDIAGGKGNHERQENDFGKIA